MTTPIAAPPEIRGKRILLTASTGGHLAQLVRWSERLGCHEDSLFVTFENEQSKSLLQGRRVAYVPYVAPRDYRGVARVSKELWRLARAERFDAILSTGAGVALSPVPVASAQRIPYYFIESVSRFDGPSLTGRLLDRVPTVECFTQHPSWLQPGWKYAGSLLNDYEANPRALPSGGLKLFVTLGTIQPYRFDSMVDSIASALTSADEVVWQLGCTERSDLPGRVHTSLPSVEFDRLAKESDAVLTHAGVGTLLRLLELGVRPHVFPRLARRGEHVDNHQLQATAALSNMSLVTATTPETFDRSLIFDTAAEVSLRIPQQRISA